MAYPPSSPLTTSRTGATATSGNHASDHNATNQVVNDIVTVLGTGPQGSSADLTTRLAAIAGADPSYTTIQDEGTTLTARRILNFLGNLVTAVDDGTDSTDVTISYTPTLWDCTILVKSGAAVVGDVLQPGVRVPRATTLTKVIVRCNTSAKPTGSSLSVRLDKVSSGATTILGTFSIAAGASLNNTTVSVALAASDIIIPTVTAIGSTAPGSDIAVDLVGT